MNCNDFSNWESVSLYCRFSKRGKGYVSNEVSAFTPLAGQELRDRKQEAQESLKQRRHMWHADFTFTAVKTTAIISQLTGYSKVATTAERDKNKE